ncbi:MAG: outer membrane beta-barrel protein [Vicinamibacterales bacterium]|nr:outer membrane beta-barrel protein [Vicinamibacterales bacterium]
MALGRVSRVAKAVRLAVLAAVVWAACPASALAQVQVPKMGVFAVDLRGVFARYGPTDEQAAAIGYHVLDLPPRGWGIDVGAHVYPIRWYRVALGIGANVMRSAGNMAPVNAIGKPTGREADTRFRTVGSQLSVNFGNREGWSYLSAGLGYSTFATSNAAYLEPETLPKRRTLNYGFGARWGFREHMAFSLDFRFYRIAAQEATPAVAAAPGTTRFTLGAGLAFK